MNLARRLLTGATISFLVAMPAMAQNRQATLPPGAQSCEGCHGPGGDSKVSTTPRLNGQKAEYISARLKALSTQSNRHAQIDMLKALPGQSAGAIAQYFASQPSTAPKPGARAEEGKRIYEKGAAADNVIACNQCHGAGGEGHDAVPRLAGQHADYLKAQLRLFSMKFRDHVLMHPNTKTMSASTMDALTAYLAND